MTISQFQFLGRAMTATIASKRLQGVLRRPSYLAEKLEWHQARGGTLLCVSFSSVGSKQKNSCSAAHVATCRHPSFSTEASNLSSLATHKRGLLTEQSLFQLTSLIRHHSVCGLLVAWPVQKEDGGGTMGYGCGRTIRSLEHVIEKCPLWSRKEIPICLWEPLEMRKKSVNLDEWGRNPIYGRRYDGTFWHSAREEQYHAYARISSLNEMYQEFVSIHWPELYYQSLVKKPFTVLESKNTSRTSLLTAKRRTPLIERQEPRDPKGEGGHVSTMVLF